MSEGDTIAARGEVTGESVSKSHHEAWDEAMDKALRDLDGPKYAGQDLVVRHVVQITPNPGGVSHYSIELVSKN
jgi:hypothetical protein